MPDLKQFKMPDVGEGLTEADILKWAVSVGDTVEHNQVLVEVETAKAAVELPSPFEGVVTELLAKEGDTVEVGAPIITIDLDPSGAAPAAQTGASEPARDVPGPSPVEEASGVLGEGGAPKRQPVLVGYGPREGTAGRRARRTAPSANTAFNVPPAGPAPQQAVEPADETPDSDGGQRRHRVLAKPPVRKLAKSLGVDLTSVEPSGPHGTVTRADVHQAAGAADGAPAGTTGGTSGTGGTGSALSAAAAQRGERETRVPIRGVRKHTAHAMVSSAFTAPHVTEFITCDVTATMELRDRVAARREFRDVKVSPLLFVAKAVILAARRTPQINATWDDAAQEIVLKHYVNLGIAAATDRGLVVPNIKDADTMSLLDLARAIAELTDTARAGKTSPSDMSGGTITITNIGVFGIDTGTPILNPGETGIVAFGAIRKMPWVVDDQIVPRWVTQLAVSFDHRVVDGQQGSQFLADVAGILSDPGLSLL